MASNAGLAGRSTMKPTENHRLDDALYYWFTQVGEIGSPISGPVHQEKVMLLNKAMGGNQNFAPSLGWFRLLEKSSCSLTNQHLRQKTFHRPDSDEWFKDKFLIL